MSALEKKPSREGRRVLLFLVYLVLLAWIVLWKLELPYIGGGALRHIKLVPFAQSAGAGSSAPLEVIANIVLFIPFGLYLSILAPSWPWRRAAEVAAGASLVLEAAQYGLALGSSDVTDVVVNAAGNLTVLALLACGIFVASPLRYAPPRSSPRTPCPSRTPGHRRGRMPPPEPGSLWAEVSADVRSPVRVS